MPKRARATKISGALFATAAIWRSSNDTPKLYPKGKHAADAPETFVTPAYAPSDDAEQATWDLVGNSIRGAMIV